MRPGRHERAAHVVDGAGLRQRRRHVVLGADPGDAVARERDRALRDEAVRPAVRAGREGGVADHPGPGRGVEGCHGRRAYRKPLPPRYAACLSRLRRSPVPDSTITREFVAALPKTDLHVHLDGSLRIPTLIELARADHGWSCRATRKAACARPYIRSVTPASATT